MIERPAPVGQDGRRGPTRLLKKVQTTHPSDGYPAARERAGYPPEVGHRRWAFFSSLLTGAWPSR